MRGASCVLVLLSLSAALAQDGPSAWLETLREEPLDLRTAEMDELAQLPWLDRLQAEAIVGLREAGELRTADDLVRSGILDARGWRAIEPFVQLQPSRREARLRVELVSNWLRRAADPTARARASATWGAWSMGARENGRGWLGLDGNGMRWRAGWVRVARDRDLLVFASGSRSRTAPLSAPSAAAPRASAVLPRARLCWAWEDRLALESDGDESAMHFGLPGGVRGGARLRPRAEPLWLIGCETDRADLVWLREGGAADFVLGRAVGKWSELRSGIDFAQASGRFSGSRDPISGRLLDRSHRVFQIHLRVASASHSTLVLLRQTRRAAIGDAVRDELRLRVDSTLRASHWRVLLRGTLDREDSEEPHFRISGTITRSFVGGMLQEFSLRWEPRESADARLIGVSLRRHSRWSWQLEYRRSDGQASVFDALGIGGAARPLWLGPGEERWAAGVDRGRWTLWLESVRSDPDSAADLRAGAAFGGRWGAP